MKAAFALWGCLLVTLMHARLPDLIPFRKGALWGYCDSTKKIIIQPAWEEVGFFSGWCAPVKSGNYWGVIDRTGTFVIKPLYHWIEEDAQHGLRKIQRVQGGPMGALNDSGRIVVPIAFMWLDWQGPFLEGADENYDNGVFDHNGNVVIPFIYKNYGDFPESIGDSGLFAMSREIKHFSLKPRQEWGVVDTMGNVIIPFEYDWITKSRCGNFEAFPFQGDPVFFDLKGNRIGTKETCEPSAPWTTWFPLTNGMQAFPDNYGKWGYSDASGKVIIAPKFCTAHNFRPDGLAEVWIQLGNCNTYGRGFVDVHGTEYWED